VDSLEKGVHGCLESPSPFLLCKLLRSCVEICQSSPTSQFSFVICCSYNSLLFGVEDGVAQIAHAAGVKHTQAFPDAVPTPCNATIAV